MPFHIKKNPRQATPSCAPYITWAWLKSTPISRKKNKVNIACGTNNIFFSPYSLSLPVRRPPASINYTPACPSARLPAQSQPFSATKKTEQNECDCIIFVTLCSSNCLYTKKKQQISKNRLQLCRNISLGMTATTTTYNKYFLCLR